MQIVPNAEVNNGDTIRVSAPASAPVATTIVLRGASPVAVNEVVNEVAEQEIAKNNTMLVAEASATGARQIKKRKSGNIAR